MKIEYRKVPLDVLFKENENGETVQHELLTSGKCVLVDKGYTYGYVRCIGGEDTVGFGELLGTKLSNLGNYYKKFFTRTRVKRIMTDEEGNTYETEMLVEEVLPDDVIIEQDVEPVKFYGE